MSLVSAFTAIASAYGLRVPAPPSLANGGALVNTDAYRHVQSMAAGRRARVDGFLRGQATHGLRLDAAALGAEDAHIRAESRARECEWADAFAAGAAAKGIQGVRADALVPVASQALTEFFSTVYKIEHNDLPAWEKRILKVDTRVGPGAVDYVWYERDIVGVARAVSTYDTTTIPLVAGPAAQANRGLIVPAMIGMDMNFMEDRFEAMARQNGKPDFNIQEGKREACQRAIAEFFNFLWMYGDPTLGIDGLMNHPDVSMLNIVGLWSSKTALQILDDLLAMAHAIPNRTGGQLGDRGRIKIMLPPAAYQRLSIPITAAGDKSILAYFTEFMKAGGQGAPTVVEEFSFAAANSQIYNGGPQGLARDRALVLYDQGSPDKDPTFILSQPIETPAPARETGAGSVVYYHARGGGMRLPDARGILMVEGLS